MKFLAAIAAATAAVALPACGGQGDGAAAAGGSLARSLEKAGPGVPVPHGPPPSKLVVKTIRRGSGPVMRNGEAAAARYMEIDYRSGKILEQDWSPPDPRRFTIGRHEVLPAWETGLQGTRVGGRRELILPPRLAYTPVPVVYVVELMSLSRRP